MVKELQSFISAAQNQAVHSSLASIRAEFVEISCCKWKTVDKAEVGQATTYGTEGVRLVVLILNQQDALQPHQAPTLMSGKLSSWKAPFQWVWDEYLCMWENEYHFSHKWISALKLEVGEMTEIILLLNT